jgi:BirA family biotin operon repressor/biotin-[acetyl-CoA-carboxylase] ligase
MISVSETTRDWAAQRQVEIEFSTQTGSTNDDAKAANDDRDFVVYLTDHQSAGRGRGANHWLDTGAGEGLLSTWCLRLPSAPQAIAGPRIGLALFETASGAWPSLSWSLKAPNDLYLNGKKTAGLLLEAISDGADHRLLIGLGFNVINHPRRFNEATHLSEALGRPPEEGEWFQFLDEWRHALQAALPECLKPRLTAATCAQLKNALNANSAKTLTIDSVSPLGDLIHAGGSIKWSDL